VVLEHVLYDKIVKNQKYNNNLFLQSLLMQVKWAKMVKKSDIV